MKLSIIIPVYNEKNTFSTLIQRVVASDIGNVEKEIIVVDDGSDDGTRDIIKQHDSDDGIIIELLEKNSGKGYAIRKGISRASGDIVLIQDADLEYDPDDYKALIEPIISGKAKVVYGSRWLQTHLKDIPWSKYKLARGFLTYLSNMLYKADITDEPTCYKVFDSQLLKSIDLKCKGFEFCPEITAKVRKMGYKIYEVPISYNPRSIEEGKKIKLIDGLIAIITLIKYRFIK